MSTLRIGFIGAGSMAQAMARGAIRAGIAKSSDIIASSPKSDLPLLKQMEEMGCSITFSNKEVAAASDITVLAVKPNVVLKVLADIKGTVTPEGTLLASIAMGVPLSTMEGCLSPRVRVMRCMPNTPALVRQAATVYCRGAATTQQDVDMTTMLFTAMGDCHEVPEDYINAVTGLSGAGPAYACLVVEALADGGVRMGLPRELALKLAAKTLMGGAAMMLDSGIHPGALKDKVCSPGGCSIEGVAALEAGGLRGALIAAVTAATARANKIGGDK